MPSFPGVNERGLRLFRVARSTRSRRDTFEVKREWRGHGSDGADLVTWESSSHIPIGSLHKLQPSRISCRLVVRFDATDLLLTGMVGK